MPTVKQIPLTRTAQLTASGRHQLQYRWLVPVADRSVDVAGVHGLLAADGITLNMEHSAGDHFTSTVPGHYLQSLDVVEKDGLFWEVTGTFAQYDPSQAGGGNPLDAKAQWTIRQNVRQIPLDVDLDNIPIRNSAGQRFTAPVTRDVNEPIISITRNETNYPYALVASMEQKVNAATFLGLFPAGTARFLSADISSNGTHPSGNYVTVNYQFIVKTDGWHAKPIDRGTAHLVGGAPAPIYTEDGTAIKTEETLLDGNGNVLPEGSTVEAVYLDLVVYGEADFDLFNFVF